MLALVYTLDGRVERHLLATGDTTVGRSPVCDLIISDPSISRRHARFRVHGDHCLLTDLGGRNGTYLNGELIAEAALKTGDAVTLGRFPLQIQDAVDAGLWLGPHEPSLDTPATVAHRIEAGPSDTLSWRPVADPARLFALVSTIARHLVGADSSRDLIARVVDAMFEALPVDRAFLLVPGPPDAGAIPQVARTRDGRPADGSTVSRAVIARVMGERLALLSVDDPPTAGRGHDVLASSSQRRWFVAAPLWSAGEVVGALYGDRVAGAPLDAADLDVLHALAIYAAAALSQARDSDRWLIGARRLRDQAGASGEAPTPRNGLDASPDDTPRAPAQKT
jgi:hypothetical protein